jgi:hypothetical protein
MHRLGGRLLSLRILLRSGRGSTLQMKKCMRIGTCKGLKTHTQGVAIPSKVLVRCYSMRDCSRYLSAEALDKYREFGDKWRYLL